LDLATYLHLTQLAMDVVCIHVEIVALEGVSIVASVDRPKIHVEVSTALVKAYDHFEGCNVVWLKHDVIAICS